MQSPVSPVIGNFDGGSDRYPTGRGNVNSSRPVARKEYFPNVGDKVGYLSGAETILCEVSEILQKPLGSISNGMYMLLDLDFKITRSPFRARGDDIEFPYSKPETPHH